MSKAVSSPTARLLKSSRLFSLPRPLPIPELGGGTVSSGTSRISDSATTPYPTHQAITTPAASLSRGDWGLKRPLPGKTTRRTSTPHIRVRAQDTSEHIVDFTSAGDHTQTVRKWQEMGIPIVHPSTRSRVSSGNPQQPLSVYEEWLDRTDPNAAAIQLTGKAKEGAPSPESASAQRWKYSGPWLSGMQPAEFEAYLRKVLVERRVEWRAFLRTHFTQEQMADRQREARDAGEAMSKADLAKTQRQIRLTDEELDAATKRLRDRHLDERLSSDLTALICKFLDLPAIGNETSKHDSPRLLAQIASNERGPPSTHPGAGLSHIRTNAVMFNHPIHGPQASPSPVLARVVRPCTSDGHTVERVAKIGVGGVVASDPVSMTYNPYSSGRDRDTDMPNTPFDPKRMAYALDEDMPGGNKMWVRPHTAYIDEKCRIQLDLGRADREAIAVRQGNVEHIHKEKHASIHGPAASSHSPSPFGEVGHSPGGAAAGSNYGYSLPRRPSTPPQRVR